MAEKKDPMIELNRRAMEFIWNKVPKEVRDGAEYVTYVKTDLPYLYYSGMVDTKRFRLEQWEKAFEDCVGEDGRIWVSHEKMLSLGRFRYSKVVGEPFDPLKMREGKYQVDRIWKVFETSIIPSCSLPPEFLKNIFDSLVREKKSFKDLYSKEIHENKEAEEKFSKFDVADFEKKFEGDSVIVERRHLVNLRNLLDTYPSPRRKLETSVHDMRAEKLNQLAGIAKDPQKSTFESGPDFRETTKTSLKDMLVKASANPTAGRKPTGEVINVKDKQSRRPKNF